MTTTFYQFLENKKRQEMQELEAKLKREEEALKKEYEAFVEAERLQKEAEKVAMWGANPNVNALRVYNGTPYLMETDDFSNVKNITPVTSLSQLTHQQQSDLYNIERGVFGRLNNGMTNFIVDEHLMGKAYSMRLENFDEVAHAFELGAKKGFNTRTVEQLLETKTPAEVIKMIKTHG